MLHILQAFDPSQCLLPLPDLTARAMHNDQLTVVYESAQRCNIHCVAESGCWQSVLTAGRVGCSFAHEVIQDARLVEPYLGDASVQLAAQSSLWPPPAQLARWNSCDMQHGPHVLCILCSWVPHWCFGSAAQHTHRPLLPPVQLGRWDRHDIILHSKGFACAC